MKKLTALLLCFVLLFALCACAKESADIKEPEGGNSPAINPCREYSSLDEINAIVGGNLMHPAVMGVEDKAFIVIDCGDYKIAEYQFNVAGFDYSFRCAKENKDISGVYMGGEGTAFADGNTDEMQINCGSEYKCARWFDGDMQYVLTLDDAENAMTQDNFESIATELMQLSTGEI